ncbi:DNA binding protein [Aureococcus anophagefferens]|nr:DNA binding protein [Aureococcus anophagefferens]
MGVKILVSGPVRGAHGALFAAASKAQSKIGPVAALFCVGDFFGERVDEAAVNALPDAPIPTYFITGGDVVDNDLADRLAAKNVRWLGRSGCDAAGLRVGFLGGALGGDFEDDAPADGSDSPHYRREDLETLAIASGAYRADGGMDVLLTSDTAEGASACLGDGDERKDAVDAGASAPLGAALAELKCSYHFAASQGDGWSLEPYRCGAGGFARLARLHALPRRGLAKSLRAFDVAPFVAAHFDLDTAGGARDAALHTAELRAATANPYAVFAARKPKEFASFPTGFKSRGAKLKTETKIVEGPARPVYGAPNRPEEPAPWQPAEKKEKRQSIYAPGSSLANPSKKKRKRMGAPHGPQF